MESFGELITEGKAQAYLPHNVFYNPVQEFNRDLTVTVISEYGKLVRQEASEKLKKNVEKQNRNLQESNQTELNDDIADDAGDNCQFYFVASDLEDRETGIVYDDGLIILEGLAATGLRSVRFCKEIPGLKRVLTNDFDRNAVNIMKENVKLNQVEHLMETSCEDAAMLMYEASRGRLSSLAGRSGFSVIDLDPYGGPTKFLDAALQAISEGGLLCVTCTDMAILCGNASEKCYAAYGAMSLKSKKCHEIALRIVLQAINSYANRYAKYIVPLLSVSVDFYCRVFVRVFTSPSKVKESASKMAMVYECSGCGIHTLQPLARTIETKAQQTGQVHKKYTFGQGPPVDRFCQHCNHTHHIGGPLWAGPLHDQMFIQSALRRAKVYKTSLGTSDRIIGMLSVISEELPDVALYYLPDQLAGVLHCTVPGFIQFRSAVLHAGYRVSLSHANKISIKTDAPSDILWDILRCWIKDHPVKESRLIEGTPCAAILSKEPVIKANFEPHDSVKPSSMKNRLLRFQTGKKGWGPKARASNQLTQVDKRKLNQNKRSEKRKLGQCAEYDCKKFICTSMRRKGTCAYGGDCKYSHDLSSLSLSTSSDKQERLDTTEDKQNHTS